MLAMDMGRLGRTHVRIRWKAARLPAFHASQWQALREASAYRCRRTNEHRNDDHGRSTPNRFADGSQGVPAGFSIYVGPKGAFYEIRSRVGKKAVPRARVCIGVAERGEESFIEAAPALPPPVSRVA